MRVTLSALVTAVALAALGGTARAYPQFQLSMEAKRCSQCHFSPSGGGLLTPYGRDANARLISQTEGNPNMLHGLYEEHDYYRWSVDLRGAALYRLQGDDEDDGAQFFPMQGDFYNNIQINWLSIYAAVGPRAVSRTEKKSFVDRITAREYYVMARKGNRGLYLRAGRFFAPFGLRSQNHTDYVRRFLGFHSLEETLNLSVGNVDNDHEWHVTAHAATPYDLQGNGPRGYGGTAYYEKRFGDATALAGQARFRADHHDQQAIVGAVAKRWLSSPGVILMAELDLVGQRFPDVDQTRMQVAAYASAGYFPFQGMLLSVIGEHITHDLSVKDTDREAASLSIQYFPRSHHELMLTGKVDFVSTFAKNTSYLMLQYHYWL